MRAGGLCCELSRSWSLHTGKNFAYSLRRHVYSRRLVHAFRATHSPIAPSYDANAGRRRVKHAEARITCRTWQALRHSVGSSIDWKPVSELFISEGTIEGLPLLFMSVVVFYRAAGMSCLLANCNLSTIEELVSPGVYMAAASVTNGSFNAAVADAIQTQGCSDLALTPDGWLTVPYRTLDITHIPVPPRVLEYPLPVALSCATHP